MIAVIRGRRALVESVWRTHRGCDADRRQQGLFRTRERDDDPSHEAPHARAARSEPARGQAVSIIGARPSSFRPLRLLGHSPNTSTRCLSTQVNTMILSSHQTRSSTPRLPWPDYDLGVGSRGDAEQLRLGERLIAEVIEHERPRRFSSAGTRTRRSPARVRRGVTACPVIHIEAGLRSYRSDMPEERNRTETDHLSDLLCAPTQHRSRHPGG